MPTSKRDIDISIAPELAGLRLDRALARLLPDYSRAQLQRWLADGALTVDAGSPASKTPVAGGERVRLRVPDAPHTTGVEPEAIALDILYADGSVFVVNKPAGRIMHPGAGHRSGTLQNALMHHDPMLAELPRAGIVHRLDKDTTGAFVVARSHRAHQALVAAIAERRVERGYEAVVVGVPIAGGRVDAAIGRHPVRRQRMTVRADGRPAATRYRVEQRFFGHARLDCQLESGRTHQIRVHLAHIGYPVLGDPVYGGRLAIPAGATRDLAGVLRGFRRQALHARRLAFTHPVTGEPLAFDAPRPADFEDLLAALAHDACRREP